MIVVITAARMLRLTEVISMEAEMEQMAEPPSITLTEGPGSFLSDSTLHSRAARLSRCLGGKLPRGERYGVIALEARNRDCSR